ncbi:MAG: hypothetical protein ACYCTV_08790, partial [Leptospirales bacterium]
MKTRTKKLDTLLKTRIASTLLHGGLGLLMAFSGVQGSKAFAAGSSTDTYKQEQSGKIHTVFGGIIVHVQKMASSRKTWILLDTTPMDRNGHPVCQKPTGNLVRILSGPKFGVQRERSAFVVVQQKNEPLRSVLNVGDCLTVDGNEVDPFTQTRANEDSIRILPLVNLQAIPLIQALSVTLWPGSQSQEVRRTTRLPAPAP